VHDKYDLSTMINDGRCLCFAVVNQSHQYAVSTFVVCRTFNRYIEVFRSNSVEMHKRGRPPPLMSTRPGPYDRPGFRNPYAGRSRMRGQMSDVHMYVERTDFVSCLFELFNYGHPIE